MIKLPAYLLWHQALNWMVTGEARDCDPLLIELEQACAAASDEPRPVQRMSLEDAKAALLDRLESGVATATGEKREAIGVTSYETKSLPGPIPPHEWPNLRIDDATSFAEIDRRKVSIPGQGYANVRLHRDDVLAALEAAQNERRAEQVALVSLLAPIEPEAPGQALPPASGASRTLTERQVKDWLDQRAKAWPDRPWRGQTATWSAAKAELGGGFARLRFVALFKDAMKRHNIDQPKAGSPGKRIAPVN